MWLNLGVLVTGDPGTPRIQQEYVEEMKKECFYEGLNSKYRCMLAHKVDGEHPTSYSFSYNLLLAAQKLERWAEARDPLLPKITTTGGSNVTHSQTPRNLFPSRKAEVQLYLHCLIHYSGKH